MLQNITHAAGVKLHELLLVFGIRRRNGKYRINIVIICMRSNLLHLLHGRSHGQIKGAFILISHIQLAVEPVIRHLHTFADCSISKADSLRRACRSKSLKALQQISVCFIKALHCFCRNVAQSNIFYLHSLFYRFLYRSCVLRLVLFCFILTACILSIDIFNIINICISVSRFFILFRSIYILVTVHRRQQVKSVIGRNHAGINFKQYIGLLIDIRNCNCLFAGKLAYLDYRSKLVQLLLEHLALDSYITIAVVLCIFFKLQ